MRASFGIAFALTLAFAAHAAAQVPPPPATASPPDVVLTHQGGMLRGTIVESVPNQYVVITLPTGETRRVEWSTVRYAGTAASAPQDLRVETPASYGAATTYGTPTSVPIGGPAMTSVPSGGGVRVRFESPQPGITFHRVTGTATAVAWGGGNAYALRAHSFERLCAAPCELTLEPGNYQIALSIGEGAEVLARSVDVRQSGTFTGEYVDQSGLRTAGWLSLVLGPLVGAAMMTVPLLTSDFSNDDWVGWMIAGAAVAVVTEIVGLALAFQNDGALIRFD